jgi:hypothetical protein
VGSFKWVNYVFPTDQQLPAKSSFLCKIIDQRKRGRQELKWEDELINDVKALGVRHWKAIARNSQIWQMLLQKPWQLPKKTQEHLQNLTNLAMVCTTRNHWAYGLGLSSGILNNDKTQHFGNCTCLRFQVRGRRHILLGPLERANQWLKLDLSKGPNRVGVSHLLTWWRKQIQFLKRYVF